MAVKRAEVEEEAKYSPDQPRVPKRNPGGGQFTRIGGGIGQSPSPNIREGEFDMAARGNEAECDLQYKRDKLICNLVRTRLCWAQAAERYAACLSGRPIPMLRF